MVVLAVASGHLWNTKRWHQDWSTWNTAFPAPVQWSQGMLSSFSLPALHQLCSLQRCQCSICCWCKTSAEKVGSCHQGFCGFWRKVLQHRNDILHNGNAINMTDFTVPVAVEFGPSMGRSTAFSIIPTPGTPPWPQETHSHGARPLVTLHIFLLFPEENMMLM